MQNWGVTTINRKVSHRLRFAWVPSIGMLKGLLTTLTTENIFISSFDEQFYKQQLQIISGSKAMDWNFQCVKYLDKYLEQDEGRKSEDRDAEFNERIRKEWACLQSGGSFVVSDPSARPYLKVAGPTWKIQSSSKLWQFRFFGRWQAEIPYTPLGLTGAGKHYDQAFWSSRSFQDQ